MAYVQGIKRPFWNRNRTEAVDDREIVEPAPVGYGTSVLSQVIWLVAGVILLLLAFRFILSLLGANTANSFANFIYSASHPFVSPFFGLFHYNVVNYGVSHFEIYTLVAMLVYAAIAWILSSLVNIGRR